MCTQKEICTAMGLVPGKEQIALKVKKRYREKQPKINSGPHWLA